MRRKKLHIRESHSFPYKWNIGYWEGRSGIPDRDFRLVLLKDYSSIEEARPDFNQILEEKKRFFC